MFKYILGATLAVLLPTGSIYAQRGGGGHGGGGGGGAHFGGGGYRGGYGGYGGYRGGYGGYGGYGRGFYGGYGGYGFGGLGYYGYGLGGYGYGLGGYGYGVGGYGYPSYDYPYSYNGGYTDFGSYGTPSVITPSTTVVPYSSSYTPPLNQSDPHSPTIIETGATSSGIPVTSTATVANPAKVAVLVPQGGKVWFNDTLNPPKAGEKWVFTTDKLDPGKTYILNIKANWNEGGQDKSYSIPLRVEAGDNMTMDLTRIQ